MIKKILSNNTQFIIIMLLLTNFISCKKKDEEKKHLEYCDLNQNICFFSSSKTYENNYEIIILDSINNIFLNNKLFFLHKEYTNKYIMFAQTESYDVVFENKINQISYYIKFLGELKTTITSIEKKYLDNLFLDLYSNSIFKDISYIYIRVHLPVEVGDKSKFSTPPPLPPISNEFNNNFY
jgi:hypothetical protein